MNHLAPMKISDPGQFGRVGLAIGGESAEREVSLNGGRAVGESLKRQGVDFSVFDGTTSLFDAIRQGSIDRVFNLVHGPGGEDGSLQGALQLMKVPVTGSGLAASALTMDKVRSKWIWERNGIATPPFVHFGRDEERYSRVVEKFGLPLFVKPTSLGSSIGVTRVSQASALSSAVELARCYGDSVIIEAEIVGAEYFAGVIDGNALPLIRVETPNEFYDYAAKYESDETRYFCPCGLDADAESKLQELSLKAFEVLGASGWGRVDFLLDAAGTPWFLEANTTPGMTDHSLVPQAAAAMGVGFDELVWRILETSL